LLDFIKQLNGVELTRTVQPDSCMHMLIVKLELHRLFN